ncbi:MAG: hypothetical protein HC927_08360 [Deltaproteobacteria bacterium]|nr:hypothetical protein [Deltaproteobacteria bacterium]
MGTSLLAALAVTQVVGCADPGPCEEQPDSIFCAAGTGSDDEVGGDPDGGDTGPGPFGWPCAPFDPDLGIIGNEYACQGTGNGWLVLDVYGDGKQPPACVNWGPKGKPKDDATIADCVPLDLTMLPNSVPSPGACCIAETTAEKIISQCTDDCGYAACKLAVAKMREAADSLPDPDAKPFEKIAQERVSDDLDYLADKLEQMDMLELCAKEVANAQGEVTEFILGAGDSPAKTIGHVENAILSLQCTLDEADPFVLEGGACDSTPNIPVIEDQSDQSGIAATGAITSISRRGTRARPSAMWRLRSKRPTIEAARSNSRCSRSRPMPTMLATARCPSWIPTFA